jgi:hypothetical protein
MARAALRLNNLPRALAWVNQNRFFATMTEKLMLTSKNDVALPTTARWLKMKVLRTILRSSSSSGCGAAVRRRSAARRSVPLTDVHLARFLRIMCIIARLPFAIDTHPSP